MAVDPRLVETCSAPTNIAVIKYWGKRNKAVNTPINSSTSVTLNQDDLRATTTVVASKTFEKDRLWLNGAEESVESNKRILAVLREMRSLAGDRKDPATGEVIVKKEDWSQYKFNIVSRNNFPTAAGLASSAAGYACLVFTLSKLLCVSEEYPGQLTGIARQGSGSASRSLMGGFVSWRMGSRDDGQDSIAEQVAPQSHWPDIQVFVLVTSAAKKDMSSSEGMQLSVATSPLLEHRAATIVEGRVTAMEEAIRTKDFATFAKLTMQDSNQFHATCLDTFPPIFYLTDASRDVIRLVHSFNKAQGEVQVAYTFDAGPNAVLYCRAQHAQTVLAALLRHFRPPADMGVSEFVPNSSLAAAAAAEAAAGEEGGAAPLVGVRHDAPVKKIYHTTVGDGPRQLSLADALVDIASGLPAVVEEEEA